MDYILAKKIKSKWWGVAGCNLGDGSCLANANALFYEVLGLSGNSIGYKSYWGCFEKQKNYAGRIHDFKIIYPINKLEDKV